MKAKELRSVVDELITLAKRGDLHARRQAASFVRNVVVDEKTGQLLFRNYLMKSDLLMQIVKVDILGCKN